MCDLIRYRFSDSLSPVLMMIAQYLQGQHLLTYWEKADRKERVAVELIVSINIHKAFFPEICLNAGFMVLESPRSFPLTTHHRQSYSTGS